MVKELVTKGLTKSQQQVVKDLRDCQDKMTYTRCKVEEFEGHLPELIKESVGMEMKLHIDDLDRRKVELKDFTKAVNKKLDRADFGELRKHLLASTS
jgi:hypothetical protein